MAGGSIDTILRLLSALRRGESEVVAAILWDHALEVHLSQISITTELLLLLSEDTVTLEYEVESAAPLSRTFYTVLPEELVLELWIL